MIFMIQKYVFYSKDYFFLPQSDQDSKFYNYIFFRVLAYLWQANPYAFFKI